MLSGMIVVAPKIPFPIAKTSDLHVQKTVAPSSRICCQEAEWHRSTLVHAWTSWRYKTLVHYTSQYLTWVLHSDIQLFSQIHGISPTPSGCQPQVLPFLVPKLQCPKGREKPLPQHPKPDPTTQDMGTISRFCQCHNKVNYKKRKLKMKMSNTHQIRFEGITLSTSQCVLEWFWNVSFNDERVWSNPWSVYRKTMKTC